MVKKLFALASVTALAGLVSAVGAAGCSSTTESTTPSGDAAVADAKGKTDAKGPAEDDDGGDTDPTGSTCLDPTPIDATKYPYKTVGVTAGACTSAELDKLSAWFKDVVDNSKDISIASWKQEVSAGCATCVFSDGSGATWTPIITKDDDLDEVNSGGCIEMQSGKEACGRSYQQVLDCTLDACLSKCKTQDDFDACRQDSTVFDSACKDAIAQVQTDCGANLGAYEQACKGSAWTFEGPIKAQCITGGGGGSDAGDGGN